MAPNRMGLCMAACASGDPMDGEDRGHRRAASLETAPRGTSKNFLAVSRQRRRANLERRGDMALTSFPLGSLRIRPLGAKEWGCEIAQRGRSTSRLLRIPAPWHVL